MKNITRILLFTGLLISLAVSGQIVNAAQVDNQVPPQSVLANPAFAPNAQGCSGTPTVQFAYANPPTINAGQVTTLYWGLVGNAQAAFLQFPNGNRQGIGTPGSQQVNPTQTSTYFVVGVCGSNQVQVPITVTVNNTPGCSGTPVFNGFTVNPTTIQNGQAATLSWGLVGNAQSVVLSSPNGSSGVPTPGSIQVNPSQTTTYTLTAWCQGNSATAQVTLTVSNPPPPTPPPSQNNQITSIQKNGGLTNSNQLTISVGYFWNGEDSPANLQAHATNSSGQVVGTSNATRINPNTNVPANLLFQPYPPGMTNVTACIIGSSGTELACQSTGMQ
ncbi:MAG: hypothetical protein EYC68_16435 [Chloroflexota bacterium]|nr:MAG: hypothetical protein EYC68_16435 [Chloroflexota bacterium]